jgi:hypothetical protein
VSSPHALPIAFETRWRARGELYESVKRLRQEALRLEAMHTPRRRQRRPEDAAAFTHAAEQLLCNLAAVELVAPGRMLATPRDRNSNARGKAAGSLLDTLAAGGLLSHHVGGWNADAQRRHLSTSMPTIAILDYLPRDLAASHLATADGGSLELRTRKDAQGMFETLPVPDIPEAKLLAMQVERINSGLEHAAIARADSRALWLHEPKSRLPKVTGMQSRQLRRVFNNARLAHGGRLVGGFWLAMSQQERASLLRIEGERIAELDFVAMVPRVCYALRDVSWPFGDDKHAPYIAGPQASREAWKPWTLAMLTANCLPRSWLGKIPAARIAFGEQFGGLTCMQAREAVLTHHAPLHAAGGFGCELGMEAMRAESDIAVDVVLGLNAQGITCLPVHDGFCVPASKTEETGAAMTAAAASRLGVPMAVVIK